jgi:hypothetical protein
LAPGFFHSFNAPFLRRYLCERIGQTNANTILPKYQKTMQQLERMTDIILAKRLPF